MNVEDPNVYMSRFNSDTWEGFVMARKPTQGVCNLHEQIVSEMDLPCLEIDVKSCRLNGIIEGNAHEIPVFSPLDEFTKQWKVSFQTIHGLILAPFVLQLQTTYMMARGGMIELRHSL